MLRRAGGVGVIAKEVGSACQGEQIAAPEQGMDIGTDSRLESSTGAVPAEKDELTGKERGPRPGAAADGGIQHGGAGGPDGSAGRIEGDSAVEIRALRRSEERRVGKGCRA